MMIARTFYRDLLAINCKLHLGQSFRSGAKTPHAVLPFCLSKSLGRRPRKLIPQHLEVNLKRHKMETCLELECNGKRDAYLER